jgi:hypothetical protein
LDVTFMIRNVAKFVSSDLYTVFHMSCIFSVNDLSNYWIYYFTM